jgi:hypothetical protein
MGGVRLWCAGAWYAVRKRQLLPFICLFLSCVVRSDSHLGRVEIVSGLVVGTLTAAVSTSRDGLVESATGSSTIRRDTSFREGRSIQSNLSSNLKQC